MLRIVRIRIPWANTVKHLRLHLDRRLTWRSHLSYVANRIKQRVRSLRLLLSSHNIIRRLGKLIVTTYMVSMATYAILEWGYIAKTRHKSSKDFWTEAYAGISKPITSHPIEQLELPWELAP